MMGNALNVNDNITTRKENGSRHEKTGGEGWSGEKESEKKGKLCSRRVKSMRKYQIYLQKSVYPAATDRAPLQQVQLTVRPLPQRRANSFAAC
ncbi:hypothetical protein ABVT39_003078 [Epinephelus coioides]